MTYFCEALPYQLHQPAQADYDWPADTSMLLKNLQVLKHTLPAQLAVRQRLCQSLGSTNKCQLCIRALHHMQWAVLTDSLPSTTYRCCSIFVTRATVRCLRLMQTWHTTHGERVCK